MTMFVGRFFVSNEILNNEKLKMQKCNNISHKLQVTSYHSGDDRDHWGLKCNVCNVKFSCSLPYDEPFLNYCPYCSSQEELKNANVGYIHYLWDNENTAYITTDFAEDTPEYIQDQIK